MFELFGPPNVDKLKAKGDIQGLIKASKYKKDNNIPQAAVDALIVMLMDSDDSDVRRAVAAALGKIGDIRAVEPLIAALKDSRDSEVYFKLACYSALEQIDASSISKIDVLVAIVEPVATEIRRLYSRTHTVSEGYYENNPYTNWVTTESHEEDDPDIDGIHKLIAAIPKTLRSQVAALSGAAEYLF